MSQLLTVHRAARLVGVTRGALQKKIKAGELPTFEGLVDPADLLRAYPRTQLEDNTAIERLAVIKDNAFANRVRERLLPDAQVLAARLTQLSREQARTRAELEGYRQLAGDLTARLDRVPDAGEVGRLARELRNWLRDTLADIARHSDDLHPLAVRDSFLRLMSAQVRLVPGRQDFFLDGADTILDAGLRAGVPLKYGCSDGSCGLCKARVISGEVKTTRPHADVLTDSEKRQGYTLLCCTTAVTDVDLETHPARGVRDIPVQHIEARLKGRDRHGEDLMVLHVQTPEDRRLRFLSGQYVTLGLGGVVSAALPVASCPCEDRHLQFHVYRAPGDAFADYVYTRLRDLDPVDIDGPRGDFVLREESSRPVMFFACDSGFAPIKSLIEHAVALDMAEAMHLYWIGARDGDHYFHNLCRSWSDALDNFLYTPLPHPVGRPPAASWDDRWVGAAVTRLHEDHPDIAEWDLYLAGPAEATGRAVDLLRARGVPDAHVYVDRGAAG
jgi:CDP-4-dehydro-6-deoxyglucose reductase, E3